MNMTQTSDKSASRTPLDWRVLLETFGPFLALVLLVIFSGWRSDSFLKPENVLNILRQNSFMGIVAVGMTFVIILGGIDLSVGSLLAFAGGLGIWLMNTVIQAPSIISAVQQAQKLELDTLPHSLFRMWLAERCVSWNLAGSEGWGVGVAIAAILLAGVLAGLLNGILIAKGRLAPFIATLGAMAAYRSLALSMADGGEFRSASYKLFKVMGTGGVPLPFWEVAPGMPVSLGYPVLVFAAVAIIAHVLLKKTRYGRYVYAIGCNERAAVYSAISVDRIKILTYTLVGGACGIAGLLLASRMNSVSSSGTGNLYELDAIAAVVIGGTRMNGGSGTIRGTVVGVLILGVIANMLNLLNVSPYLQGLVKGAIIIAAVLLQRGRRSA
jgi:ribose transport system permease protein